MGFTRRLVRLPGRASAWTLFPTSWPRHVDPRQLFVVDTIGLILAVFVALTAWRDEPPTSADAGVYLWICGIIVLAHTAANLVFGLYQHSWRSALAGDRWRVPASTFAGTASAAIIGWVVGLLHPPLMSAVPSVAFWLLEASLALGVLATTRVMLRAATDQPEHARTHAQPRRTLLYGAGWAGAIVARSAERNPRAGIAPVGFLDDDLGLRGKRVGGLLVHGDSTLMARAKRRTGASALLITLPHAGGTAVRRIIDAARENGLDVCTVPTAIELIDGMVDATRTRRLRIDDLLRRPRTTEHPLALRKLMSGSTVMVTGAGGEVGSELARQAFALRPSRIVLVDQAESGLGSVLRELESRCESIGAAMSITAHLLDVTDRVAIGRLMRRTRPAVVLHAAAYKDVAMLEDHPAKTVETNIGGTLSVVDAAEAAGVERFVLVSADMAAWPSSVMGASNRVAEMVVADAANRLGRPYIAVRFGKTLGPHAGVVSTLQEQLEKEGSLTIADPNMTRCFVTIPEAAWHILDAAAIAEAGGLYVLDMGEPVRVLDIARDLVRLSGRDPDSVPIKVAGLGPGEELHEELFYEKEMAKPTEVPKVLRAEPQLPPASIRADVNSLLAMAARADPDRLSSALRAYARPSEQPDGGFWGVLESGSTERRPDTRPVIILPVHGNGQHVSVGNGSGNGSGSHRARGVATWRHRHVRPRGPSRAPGSFTRAD